MTKKKVLSIEFNELCPHLVEKFINEGYLPNFKRLRETSQVFTTDAEADGEWLNPWVQWVTYHTGLPWQDHQVLTLSQGHLLEKKSTWDYISDAGKKVWVCSSMNPRADMPLNGYLLPDPWSTGVKPTPEGAFDDFYGFVKNAVQEHTTGTNKSDAKAFLSYMIRHGISFSTLSKTIRQLLEEKLTKDNWKRAMIMDRFLLDIFKHFYRRTNPDYSTFFLNSTAHFQHCYWRHMQPEVFSASPSAEEVKKYQNAIQSGYENMDQILGQLLKIVGDQTTIVFATALSQQPYLKDEESGGRRYFRLKNKETLEQFFNIESITVHEEVMADQFIIRFNTTEDRDIAKAKLESYRLDCETPFRNGNPQLYNATINDEKSLICQCRCTRVVPESAKVLNSEGTSTVDFSEIFYEFSTVKSGCHHPDGILWIRTGQQRGTVNHEKVSLNRVAPTILNLLDVDQPADMIGAPLNIS